MNIKIWENKLFFHFLQNVFKNIKYFSFARIYIITPFLAISSQCLRNIDAIKCWAQKIALGNLPASD